MSKKAMCKVELDPSLKHVCNTIPLDLQPYYNPACVQHQIQCVKILFNSWVTKIVIVLFIKILIIINTQFNLKVMRSNNLLWIYFSISYLLSYDQNCK